MLYRPYHSSLAAVKAFCVMCPSRRYTYTCRYLQCCEEGLCVRRRKCRKRGCMSAKQHVFKSSLFRLFSFPLTIFLFFSLAFHLSRTSSFHAPRARAVPYITTCKYSILSFVLVTGGVTMQNSIVYTRALQIIILLLFHS